MHCLLTLVAGAGEVAIVPRGALVSILRFAGRKSPNFLPEAGLWSVWQAIGLKARFAVTQSPNC
ncbi:hypothetical protein J2R96_006697 [Bradyrhizobium elkanii]|nr:hypothetical protein [Bradyrhizobium elkanii]